LNCPCGSHDRAPTQNLDAVVDFAAALAAPGNPERLNPLWDSGDHKHPDDAGYRTMADRAALALE
jgi:lysophospholipase L1-like esterase